MDRALDYIQLGARRINGRIIAATTKCEENL